mgnify:CR=1 FL=1
MTIKEIIQKVATVKSFKEKYNIKKTDIDLILRTAGSQGKPILQLLYVLVEKSMNSSMTSTGTANQTYKILQTKFNIT